MPRTALAPCLAALYALGCASWGASAVAAPPDEKTGRTAAILRQLRAPVREWLGRDVGEKTLAENRAYADLILAFGLARAGEPDEAKALLRGAAAVLDQEKGDPAHRCLVALYRHRIDQVVGGKPPTGPLPADLLAGVTPAGDERPNTPVRQRYYVVLRARELSRVIEPLEQVDPYLSWTSGGDRLVARLGPLQDEQNPEAFARDARALLKDGEAGALGPRLRITARLAALGPRAGDAFCVELLKRVPDLAREGRGAADEPERAGAVALVEQSLALAASLRKPELFKPLVAEAVAIVKAERGPHAPAVAARLATRCERGFRVMGLGAEAAAFLKDTAGTPPDDDTGKSWADVARVRLAGAGMRQTAGRGAEAAKLLAAVRGVVLAPPPGAPGPSYYRLVAEYAAACGRLAPADARERLEELFGKLAKVPDTYTTAAYYSRYHLMILEAAVLGLTAAGDV